MEDRVAAEQIMEKKGGLVGDSPPTYTKRIPTWDIPTLLASATPAIALEEESWPSVRRNGCIPFLLFVSTMY